MADIPAIMADIPAQMADIPAQMADLDARRWADRLSHIPHSLIQNPGEYRDSGPSSSTQRDFLISTSFSVALRMRSLARTTLIATSALWNETIREGVLFLGT